MRACSIMEKTQKSGEGVKTSAKLAEEAAEKRERLERLESKKSIQVLGVKRQKYLGHIEKLFTKFGLNR